MLVSLAAARLPVVSCILSALIQWILAQLAAVTSRLLTRRTLIGCSSCWFPPALESRDPLPATVASVLTLDGNSWLRSSSSRPAQHVKWPERTFLWYGAIQIKLIWFDFIGIPRSVKIPALRFNLWPKLYRGLQKTMQSIQDLLGHIPLIWFVPVAPMQYTSRVNLNHEATETEKEIKIITLSKARSQQQWWRL